MDTLCLKTQLIGTDNRKLAESTAKVVTAAAQFER